MNSNRETSGSNFTPLGQTLDLVNAPSSRLAKNCRDMLFFLINDSQRLEFGPTLSHPTIVHQYVCGLWLCIVSLQCRNRKYTAIACDSSYDMAMAIAIMNLYHSYDFNTIFLEILRCNSTTVDSTTVDNTLPPPSSPVISDEELSFYVTKVLDMHIDTDVTIIVRENESYLRSYLLSYLRRISSNDTQTDVPINHNELFMSFVVMSRSPLESPRFFQVYTGEVWAVTVKVNYNNKTYSGTAENPDIHESTLTSVKRLLEELYNEEVTTQILANLDETLPL